MTLPLPHCAHTRLGEEPCAECLPGIRATRARLEAGIARYKQLSEQGEIMHALDPLSWAFRVGRAKRKRS